MDVRRQDSEGGSDCVRLDSWKAIAAHLGRDIRTVQRWEESEQLPVHRHLHKQRGTVYAYPDELDRWLEARRSNRPPTWVRPSSRPWPRWIGLGTATVGLLALLIGFFWSGRNGVPSPVTTSSADALRLYQRAEALLSGSETVPAGIPRRAVLAEELLEEAVAFDPDFASAYLKLAIARQQRGEPYSEYQDAASMAFELRDTVSDQERLTIEAGYYWLMNDADEAILRLETLTTLYPEDAWALRLLSGLYYLEGRPTESLMTTVRLADLDAGDFLYNALAASNLLMRGDSTQLDDAARYAQRAMIAAPTSNSHNWLLRARTELFPVYAHWMRGDVRAAVTEADDIAATLNARAPGERGALREHLMSIYLTLGRTGAARALTQSLPAEDMELELTAIDLSTGLSALARAHAGNWADLAAQTGREYSPGHWALARLGVGAELVRSVPPSARAEDAALYALDGGLRALSDRQYGRAINLLESGIGTWQSSNSHGLFQLLGALAEAQLATDQVDAAVLTLEASSRLRGRAAVTGEGYWISNQWTLASLYDERGLQEKANLIRHDLALLLAAADQDHPIAARLRDFSTSLGQSARHEDGRPAAQIATREISGLR